jgi:hypothetical protein
MIHWFHDWSKWERYELKIFWVDGFSRRLVGIEVRQKRSCEICGKAQDRLVARIE